MGATSSNTGSMPDVLEFGLMLALPSPFTQGLHTEGHLKDSG